MPLKRAAHILVWLLAATLAVWLYLDTRDAATLPGLVEIVSVDLAPLEGGALASLSVSPGDEVKAGDLLASVDDAALQIELKLLNDELDASLKRLDANRSFSAATHKARGDALRDELLQLREDAQAQEGLILAGDAEVARFGEEIARLEAARQAGLGRADELSSLLRLRDVSARKVQGLRSTLATSRQRYALAQSALDAWAALDPQPLADPALSTDARALDVLKRRIAAVEARIASHKILAPFDGRVTALLALQGQIIAPFTPVVSLQQTTPGKVDAFLPEASPLDPHPGDLARITSPTASCTGRVAFLDPGMSPLPLRLRPLNGAEPWSRRLRLDLDAPCALLPGQRVEVKIDKDAAP